MVADIAVITADIIVVIKTMVTIIVLNIHTTVFATKREV